PAERMRVAAPDDPPGISTVMRGSSGRLPGARSSCAGSANSISAADPPPQDGHIPDATAKADTRPRMFSIVCLISESSQLEVPRAANELDSLPHITVCRPVIHRIKAITVAQLRRQKMYGNVTANGLLRLRGRSHPVIAAA